MTNKRRVPSEVLQEPKEDKSVLKLSGQSKFYNQPIYNSHGCEFPQREQPLRSCRSRNTVKTSDSAIGQHLLDNPDCAKLYNDDMFRIIGRARSSFHLAFFLNRSTYKRKSRHCVDRRSSFSLLHSSGNFSSGTRH